MKYKIENYDHDRLVVEFRVIQSQDPLIQSSLYPMSVENIRSVEELEKAMYNTWYRNLSPAARGNYSVDVLAHVSQTLNQVNSSTTVLATAGMISQSSPEIAQYDSSSTIAVRII